MQHLYKAVTATIKALNDAEIDGDAIEARSLKCMVNGAIRKSSDYMKPIFISEAAKEKADELGIDLFEYTWPQQYKFDKGRKVFIMEHKYPVSDMIVDMKKNPDIIEQIMESAEFGWILRSEDELLPQYGRKDHDAIYEEANIRLIRK